MNTIDYRYQSLLQDILDNGVTKQDRTGTGTISVFGRQIRHKMSDGFPLLTTKKMYFKGVATELIWFLRGDTNIKFLVDNDCHIWDGDVYKNFVNIVERSKPKDSSRLMLLQEEFINKIKTDDVFAERWGELGPIYGKQWRAWDFPKVNGYFGPIDQIKILIQSLKTNPDSRRLMVNAWNVGKLHEMILPPCHYGFQVYTRELSTQERKDIYYKSNYAKDTFPTNDNGWNNLFDGFNIPTRAISLMFNMRSNDVPLGLPFNLASYGLLLSILGEIVNMVPDELIANLGDAHIYLNQIDGVKEQISRVPYDLPTLNINTEFWQTESGECGVGPLKTNLNGFEISDFTLENYQSHPIIKLPLSN